MIGYKKSMLSHFYISTLDNVWRIRYIKCNVGYYDVQTSDSTALKTDMILKWTSLHVFRNTSKDHSVNTVHCAIQNADMFSGPKLI